MYLNIGTIALKPSSLNVRPIKQKTPIGATFMIIMVISIMMSLHCVQKFMTSCAFSFNLAKMTPTNKANTIICSISPLAKAATGLVGMIFKIVSTIDISVLVDELDTVVDTFSTALISKPIPGLIKRAIHKAIATATMVVNK